MIRTESSPFDWLVAVVVVVTRTVPFVAHSTEEFDEDLPILMHFRTLPKDEMENGTM